MPIENVILMLLIGLVLGAVVSVILKGRGILFFVNILHGIFGASLGALSPILTGPSHSINVSNPDYLIRALVGSFLVLLLASLFRSAKPPNAV